jgi:chaperone modulatory protein CbpM
MMNEYYIEVSWQEVCHSTGINDQQLLEIVECGIIQPLSGDTPAQWAFDPAMLSTARRACRLHRDLELDWEAIALVLDLLQEKEQLLHENAMLRQRLQRFMFD